MTTIADSLGTTFFQLSTVGVGALAVGIEDFRQRIFNVLNTVPGTDPLRPLFGCNAYKHTDAPLSVAIPNIKLELFDALTTWVPEIEVVSITHNIINEGQLAFFVTYRLVDDDLTDTITFINGISTGGASGEGAIIISTPVPAKVTNGVYNLIFITDGTAAVPHPPSAGFANAADMLTWINTNWANYGRWFLTGDSLILYLNTGVASKVSLTVTEIVAVTVQALIPILTSGEYFNLILTGNAVTLSPAFPVHTINTVENLFAWVNANWAAYGSWSLLVGETIYASVADFNNDFNGDFRKANIITPVYLVFQTIIYTTVTLTFS